MIATSLLSALLLVACEQDEPEPVEPPDHGPMAEGIYSRQGDPAPYATAEQLDTFYRGLEVGTHRFTLGEGLGPAFNVTFCLACHEKPEFGGSGGLYRSFFLSGQVLDDGSFVPGLSAGDAGGVIRLYYYGDEYDARPEVPEETNVIDLRNPIPFFGVGLLAELDDEVILANEDVDDADGDGISGKANYDQGFVGRFGRKSQTVSIEGFIRGPLFNHLGITTDPLSEEQRAELPVDSSNPDATATGTSKSLVGFLQAAAPSAPLTDEDDAPDPEMSTDDLFDLVSFAMLLGAPEPEPPTEQTRRGQIAFDEAGCGACHVPRLEGPRGPLPVYSDLLLHDMGPDLADGLVQGEATGSEFRTQPLWGLSSVGPYLHDGRATTIDEAILWHDGEAAAARDAYAAFDPDKRADLVEFLKSLGGRDQVKPGLVDPDEPIADPGTYGGPIEPLSPEDADRFLAGRTLFDREFGFSEGVGNPRFNGDSCRACHFEPTIGGAGPRGVNVVRHGILNDDGEFVPPSVGTILHRSSALPDTANRPQEEANVFELRQTPPLYGLGLVDRIPDETILALADPYDLDGDGISGKASIVDGGRLGRLGWKAQVPSLAEFVRDAITNEMGMTIDDQEGLTFGRIHDNDDVPDPEYSLEDAELLLFYMQNLAPPPRNDPVDPQAAEHGEALFTEIGCAACHVPTLQTADGVDVNLYSDLLLHQVLPDGAPGIEDASATMQEFRTAPLWGISKTAPYLHDGSADTLEQAIEGHDGEAAAARDAFLELSESDQADIIAFLETL